MGCSQYSIFCYVVFLKIVDLKKYQSTTTSLPNLLQKRNVVAYLKILYVRLQDVLCSVFRSTDSSVRNSASCCDLYALHRQKKDEECSSRSQAGFAGVCIWSSDFGDWALST